MTAFDFHTLLTTREGAFHEMHLRSTDGRWFRLFAPVEYRDAFAALCTARDAQASLVPRLRKNDPESYGPDVNVLVARLETGKHADQLSRFRIGPTLVIREGDSQRRWALWGLQEPVSLEVAERGNRALAYSLGCVQRHGSEPEKVFIPCPGSTVTLGKSRPVRMRVEFTSDRLYRPADFRGAVRKPPEKNTDWKKAA